MRRARACDPSGSRPPRPWAPPRSRSRTRTTPEPGRCGRRSSTPTPTPGARHDRLQHPGRRRPHDQPGDCAADDHRSGRHRRLHPAGRQLEHRPGWLQRRPADRAQRSRRGTHERAAHQRRRKHRSRAGDQSIRGPDHGFGQRDLPEQRRWESHRGQLHRHRSSGTTAQSNEDDAIILSARITTSSAGRARPPATSSRPTDG